MKKSSYLLAVAFAAFMVTSQAHPDCGVDGTCDSSSASDPSALIQKKVTVETVEADSDIARVDHDQDDPCFLFCSLDRVANGDDCGDYSVTSGSNNLVEPTMNQLDCENRYVQDAGSSTLTQCRWVPDTNPSLGTCTKPTTGTVVQCTNPSFNLGTDCPYPGYSQGEADTAAPTTTQPTTTTAAGCTIDDLSKYHACTGSTLADHDVDLQTCADECEKRADCLCISWNVIPDRPCRLENGPTHTFRGNGKPYSAITKSEWDAKCR